MRWVLTLAGAIAFAAVGAVNAIAAVTVQSFSATPSTTAAGAHPNFTTYKAVSGAIENDKFAITLSLQNANGAFTAKVKGKLSGSKASGTLRSVFKFANGSECDSGKLKWTAERS